MEIVEACLRIIWECQCRQPLAFWAMENPVGYLRRFLGRPAQTIRQGDFGGPHPKPTDLFGYFTPVKVPERRTIRRTTAQRRWQNPAGDHDRATLRAMTASGFAKAFFDANP